MRIDLAFPTLPPALDGIGDHTACLAEALAAQGASVRVLTAQAEADPIPGATVERAFSLERRRGVMELVAAVQNDPPGALVVQFNQFSYGRWGLNPYLPLALYQIKRAVPNVHLAWMAHEDFVPVTSWAFAVMTLWQRAQFWALGRLADRIFFSIDPWAQKYQSWFPKTPVHHLPVGSNIPNLGLSQQQARERIGLSERPFVVGVFGSAHGSRLLEHIRQALQALRRRTQDVTLLYVGPDGEAVRAAMGAVPVRDAGALPAEDVSVHLAAMDLHLAPFVDGASTRRGSLMAGLQHGVATISTSGALTDRMLRAAEGEALVLTRAGDAAAFARRATELWQDEDERHRLGAGGQRLYQRSFAWERLAERLLAVLPQGGAPPDRQNCPVPAASLQASASQTADARQRADS